MQKVILFSTPFITVEYHADRKLIYHTVHKPIGVAEVPMLKDALNAGTDALKKSGASKWLSDDRKNGPLPQEMVEWGASDWNPRTISAGWKYWANVVPEEVHAAGSLAPIIENLYAHGLRMRVFVSVEDALNWLDGLPNS